MDNPGSTPSEAEREESWLRAEIADTRDRIADTRDRIADDREPITPSSDGSLDSDHLRRWHREAADATRRRRAVTVRGTPATRPNNGVRRPEQQQTTVQTNATALPTIGSASRAVVNA